MSRCSIPTLFFLFILLTAACATGPQRDVTILESTRGEVYLERIPTRQFQATHPIRLDPELIAKSLQGILVRDEKGLLQSISAHDSPTIAAFSREDIAFLAPAIADGLSQAAADQQIGFRVAQTGGAVSRDRAGAGVGSGTRLSQQAPDSTTAGRLFVYGRSLYLTIHQFRHQTDPPDNINMPNRRVPEPTGLRNRSVLFMPESALRPDIYAPPFAAAEGLTTLVIDYDALAKAPTALPQTSPAPEQTPAAAPPLKDDLQQIKEQMKQKESEVDELRKELQEIKRQLGGRPPDAGKASTSKPSPAMPETRQP